MPLEISRTKLETWAGYLLEYSLGGIRSDDVVLIKGEHCTWPLLSVLQERVFAAGGIADVFLVPPDNDRGKVFGAAICRHGSVEQIQRVPDWMQARYHAMTKYIEILGAEQPALFGDLPADTAQALMTADEPTKNIRLAKPWVLTLFPTEAFAAMDGLSLDTYADAVVSASVTDPRALEQVEEPLYQKLRQTRTVRVQSRAPDGRELELRLDITGQRIVKCTGKRNFPDGEVFTSPDARSVEGEIFVDLPVTYSGTRIQGVHLCLEGGVITRYSAVQGQDVLAKIIETDEGSHRLGEVALGMNNGLKQVLTHPLFVEKVGGTLHIAIGASYPECYHEDPGSDAGKAALATAGAEGRFNTSAQHVDIVTDFRGGGAGRAVFLDDTRLSVQGGLWVVP
ncbi:MAG: aminopeptidase [Pseudomonadota bacterium]